MEYIHENEVSRYGINARPESGYNGKMESILISICLFPEKIKLEGLSTKYVDPMKLIVPILNIPVNSYSLYDFCASLQAPWSLDYGSFVYFYETSAWFIEGTK